MEKTERIFNIYQADFLLENGSIAIGCGMDNHKIYIKFLCDEIYDKYMTIWKTREH